MEKIEKAKTEKKEIQQKEELKSKDRKITEMLSTMLKVKLERIEIEIKE